MERASRSEGSTDHGRHASKRGATRGHAPDRGIPPKASTSHEREPGKPGEVAASRRRSFPRASAWVRIERAVRGAFKGCLTDDDESTGDEGGGLRLAVLVCLLGSLVLSACNPIYVIRVGWAESRILRSRVPLTEVMTDESVSRATRGKLRLVWDARVFAIGELGFQNAGESYTSLARLESDTLALVLTAAYRDRLAFRTWWFPIAGRIPYRAYFSTEAGERARDGLEAEGFDTYLRPTAAFSTLGWFADPLYSSMLRADEVELVQTVLHELAHNHLYVSGQSRFNESYATFAGHMAAIHFFCRGSDGGSVTVRCERARHRWADVQAVSRFIDALEARIVELYAQRGDTPLEDFLERRDDIYRTAQSDFIDRVQPRLRASTYGFLAAEPLNNATLLSRSLYYHRLTEFEGLWQGWGGDFPELMRWLREEATDLEDPFDLLSGSLAARDGRQAYESGPSAFMKTHLRPRFPRLFGDQRPGRTPHRE
jgi:predicted aminopeptidase